MIGEIFLEMILLLDFVSLGFGILVIFLVAILAMLFASLFWVMMLVDCAKRDFKDKTVWIIIIIFTNFLGAVLYYYIIKKAEDSKKRKSA
jgi:uncharacterized BrkB/YihY/UPF0761 family membrane protein